LYVVCVTLSSVWSVHRYRNFQSGWAWDLAHVNQSFWAITHGVDKITVRPINHYAREGPEPWRSVHLALLRGVLLPVYAIWPRPETLLVGHSAIFWLSLFGVARLASGCSADTGRDQPPLPLVAAALWAATPAAFVMALNDCRPLQLGVPFLLWAVSGYGERCTWLYIVGVIGALAARQEYGIAVAALGLFQPNRPEPFAIRCKWAVVSVLLGAGWFAAYLGYVQVLFGAESASSYFSVPTAFSRSDSADAIRGFIETAASLAILSGGWWLFALARPRFLIASLPLVCMIVERNVTQLVPSDREWHFVRYAAIPLAFWVAGGAVGLRGAFEGAPARWWKACSAGRRWAAAIAILATWILATSWVQVRFASITADVAVEEREPLGRLLDRIPPQDIVWSDWPFAARVSGRTQLFPLRVAGQPPDLDLVPEVDEWVVGSFRLTDADLDQLRSDGFDERFRGHSVHVFFRDRERGR
jgi:hypothetical protein